MKLSRRESKESPLPRQQPDHTPQRCLFSIEKLAFCCSPIISYTMIFFQYRLLCIHAKVYYFLPDSSDPHISRAVFQNIALKIIHMIIIKISSENMLHYRHYSTSMRYDRYAFAVHFYYLFISLYTSF